MSWTALANLWADSDAECCWCGKAIIIGPGASEDHSTIEHVVPYNCGGTNTIYNLDFACRSCNSRRHYKPRRGYVRAPGAKQAMRKMAA